MRADPAMAGPAKYDRLPGDCYFTEAWVTRALLGAVRFPRRVWEPACGRGDMARVLTEAGLDVISTDVLDYGFGESGRNFLAEPTSDRDAIITNPPYTLAEEFIRHALELQKPDLGMVAMLLRHEFDCAGSRRDIFRDHPAFALRLTLTKRPNWVEERKASPRHNFAWFVWDWRHRGPAASGYAP